MRKPIPAHRPAQCQPHAQIVRRRIASGAKMRSVVLIKMHTQQAFPTDNAASGQLTLGSVVQLLQASHNVPSIKPAHNVVMILLVDGAMMDRERA